LTGAPAQAAIAAADNLAARIKEVEKLEGDALAAAVQDLGRQVDEMTLPAPRKHELREQLAALTERVKAGQKEAAAQRAKAAIEQAKQIAAANAGGLNNEIIVNTVDAGSDR